MKHGMVKRVLEEAYECGTREVGLHATGESFLLKNLHEYVSMAKQIGYEYIFITTNGSLATPERAKPILDAGLDSIKFSIWAGTRESYKKLHGVDNFDLVIANLKWVSDYRKASGLTYRIYVTMVSTDLAKGEEEILKDLVVPYIDEWDPHLLNNQCGIMHENNELGTIEKHSIRGRIKSKACFQPFKSFTVTPEGYISACVIDYQKNLIVADLNKTTMKEAWANEVYKTFRGRHLRGDLKGLCCYNCLNNTNEEIIPLMPEYKSKEEMR